MTAGPEPDRTVAVTAVRSSPESSTVGPTPARPGLRAILTPSWLLTIGVAAAFAAACWFVLAPWQYGRHLDRDAQNAQIEAALAAPTVPATDLLSAAAEPEGASAWRAVTANGTFLTERQVFVRLRQADGQDAREVVVPFRLADGTELLIDRGYALTADLNAGLLPAPLPTGDVTIIGRVSADQPDPSSRPEQLVDGRTEVYGVVAAALLDGPGLRGFVQLTPASPGVLIPIGVPDRDAGPFLSYALQWCVFGAVALLAAGFFAYREVTVPYPGQTETPPKATRFDKSELYD